MPSIFTKIINGEIPSYKVAESEKFYAFLDIHPLKEGHTLVVPKKEVDYIFDLDDELYKELMLFSKRVSEALYKTIPCKRVAMAVLGMEVPHAHVHLVPMQSEGDLDFRKEKVKLTPERFAEIASSISSAFQNQ